MTIKNWKTGETVQRGELTLDPQQARRKLRDFRLTDPHRWVLEIVAAGNIGGASKISIQLDSDEIMIALHGIEFSADDIETLWQAPFQKTSNPIAKHIALGLISAESLQPTRILLRSGNVEANLGPTANRSLLEKIVTQLYPEDPTENVIQIYVRIPLTMSRLFVDKHSLPEFDYLTSLAKFSKTPISIQGKEITDPGFDSLWANRTLFHDRGLDGALSLSVDLLKITFIRDGVVTETVEMEAVIPADIVVHTQRLNYDLSGTKIIRDEAYDQVIADLIRFTRRAFESRLENNSLSATFNGIKARLFVTLLTEFTHQRTFYEETPESDLRLAHLLRDHRMWACAGSAPPSARRRLAADGWIVSLNEAMPSGNILHRSPTSFPTPFGDRAVLLTGRDSDYLTEFETVARPLVERYLEATSEDISDSIHASQRRVSAVLKWRNSPIKTPLKDLVAENTYVSSKNRSVQIGYVEDRGASQITFTHQGNALVRASGISHLRILIQNINPTEHFESIEDDEQAAQLAQDFAKTYVAFLQQMTTYQDSSAILRPEPYDELHRLATFYVSSRLADTLGLFGEKAAESVVLSPTDCADIPMFSTLAREAELVSSSKKLLNLFSNEMGYLQNAQPLVSARDLMNSGLKLAFCDAAEATRLITADFWKLAPDLTVVVGNTVTSSLLRTLTDTTPIQAATRHREIIGKMEFHAKPKTSFTLPQEGKYAAQADIKSGRGRYTIGLSSSPVKQIEVQFLHDGRVIESARLDSPGGAFDVICYDSRLTISSGYSGAIQNEGRAAVEAEIKRHCVELALKYVSENSTPVLGKLAAPLFAQLLFSGDKSAQELEVFPGVQGNLHSLAAARLWPQIYFVRHGFPPSQSAVDAGDPILVVPDNFPETALPKSKDVSDTPEIRQKRRIAENRFFASKIEPIELNRTFAENAVPGGEQGLASLRFTTKDIQGVVGLIGLKRSWVRLTLLHKGRHVGTRTLNVPFGEFEGVVNIDSIVLDEHWTEIRSGEKLADELIRQNCGECLLTWLRADNCHPDSIRAVRAAGMSLNSWSSDHVRAATHLTIHTATKAPVEVSVPTPKALGPEHACFRFLEEIRGSSNVFANVSVRGMELKELGTGLPSQADDNVIHVDPTHPTNRLALETDDPVWRAMLVSSAFTSLNLRWLAITDDHEEEFHIRMLDYMAKALRPGE